MPGVITNDITVDFVTGITDYQYVDSNDLASTKFTLPEITIDGTRCREITEMKIVVGPLFTESTEFVSLSLDPVSTVAVPVPTLIGVIKKYEFYLVIKIETGQEYVSSVYTLVVGCVPG